MRLDVDVLPLTHQLTSAMMRIPCLLLSAGLFGSALATAERAIGERSPEFQARQTTVTPAPAVAANYTIDR